MTQHSSIVSQPTLELRRQLRTGALSVVALARACLARIEKREKDVRAWACLDPERVLKEAARLDEMRQSGCPLGPLHGLPVGVKDIIDTAGIPTENGCLLDAGRVPERDATVVKCLKAAGAVIFGKTISTELAFLHPSETRNPWHLEHTPGGSSAGSAAAVADWMVPLAIGTQTGGSVIRPASFCGVTGFKPTFGTISSDGVLAQSPSLDTVGVFARDPEGAALLANALTEIPDDASEDASEEALVYGFAKLPESERAEPCVHYGLADIRRALGDRAIALELPEEFDIAAEQRAIINSTEMAHHFRHYYKAGADRLGEETRTAIEEGMAIAAPEYISALAYKKSISESVHALFDQCDVLICPATLGAAPRTLSSTGDSIFNGLWTMTGLPAVTLPLMKSDNGMPIGVQLVGPAGKDARLLGAACRLWRTLGEHDVLV